MAITISGNGIVEANLADNAVTLAKMASGTDGEILTYDASGNPVAVSVGTDGQVLTSTGAGSPPAFETAAAGGKVLQVVQGTDSSQTGSSSTTLADTGLSATITPSSTSSKILVQVVQRIVLIGNINVGYGYGGAMKTTLLRGATTIQSSPGDVGGGYDMYMRIGNLSSGNKAMASRVPTIVLDSPSTTSATTYKTQFAVAASGESAYSDNQGFNSRIILMEIGA